MDYILFSYGNGSEPIIYQEKTLAVAARVFSNK